MRGDARRVLLSRLVVEHRLYQPDPFAHQDGKLELAIAGHLLGEQAAGIDEIAPLLTA
jgi:hypothetical protein